MHNSWYILGSGAIGTLWAAKLSKADIRCVLLQREQTSVVQNEPLRLTQIDGVKTQLAVGQLSLAQLSSTQPSSTQAPSNNSSQNKPPSKNHAIDKLLICTKSYQTQAALQSIAPLLSPDASVVLLQNGMGQHEQVASLLPAQTIIAASTTEGAMLESPLNVKHTGLGISQFGSYDPSKTITSDVLQQLDKIGMIHQPNIQSVLWNKLTINCVINPLTAIFNCRNGELINNDEYRSHAQALSREVDLIAKCLKLSTDAPNTFEQVLTVAKATSKNYSSMHQDIKFARKTEIEFINGYLQHQAEAHKIPLPLNANVLERIKALETL